MSATNILLIIGFVFLCIYAIISRKVNKKNDNNDKSENNKDNKE